MDRDSKLTFQDVLRCEDVEFPKHDYRSSHTARDAGKSYNQTYEAGYYAALWTRIERPLLEQTLRATGGPHRKCLDFACGTGRIAAVAAKHYDQVVGIDVSQSMLACARVPDNVRLHCVDLTTQSLGETFDAITAFRFFLNAEHRLRTEALDAMREHLSSDGILVCNIHMNASSPIGIASRIANRIPGSIERNTLSIREFSVLLTSAGFSIEQLIPYGYLPRPGSLLPRLCEVCVGPFERIASALALPAWSAQNFLVVARKRTRATVERICEPGNLTVMLKSPACLQQDGEG